MVAIATSVVADEVAHVFLSVVAAVVLAVAAVDEVAVVTA